MARQATGTLRTLADGHAARITIKGRNRKDFVLTTCATEEEADERTKALANMAARLRRAGEKPEEIAKTLAMAATARGGRPWDAVLAAVDHICAGQTRDKRAVKIPTVKELAADWTAGRLHLRFPDHVGKKKPGSVTRDEMVANKYVLPHVGDLAVSDVTLTDCELVMANVPATLSPSSRRHVAQFLCKLLSYAVYPCRYMQVSPVPRGWLPKLGKGKALQYVRPDEDAKQMANTALPLWRRLFFGIARREGFRTEEEAALRLSEVDLKLGAVRLDENKTDSPRAWALSPDVAEALRRWCEDHRPDVEDEEHVLLDESGHRIDVGKLAAQQRADLKASDVARPELHEDGPNRRKLRAHDSRASFTTEALARGKNEAWVMDRTGWTTSAMLNRYRRAARTWTELDLGTWTPLHEAIPELRRDAMLGVPGAIAPRIAPGNRFGEVAKWSGSGLQNGC